MFVSIRGFFLTLTPLAVALVIPHDSREGAVRYSPDDKNLSCCFDPKLNSHDMRSAVMNIAEQSDHGATLLNNTLLETSDVVLRAFEDLTKKLQPMRNMPFVSGFIGNLLHSIDESIGSIEQLLMKSQQGITENSVRLRSAGEKYAANMSFAESVVQSLISDAKAMTGDAEVKKPHKSQEKSGLQAATVFMQSIFGSVKHAMTTPRDMCTEANHAVQIATHDRGVFQKQWHVMSSGMLQVLHAYPDAVKSTFDHMKESIETTISPSLFPDRLRLVVVESLAPMREAVATAVKHSFAAHAQVLDAFGTIETQGLTETKDHIALLQRQVHTACNIILAKVNCMHHQC